jgi:hypothetical protein
MIVLSALCSTFVSKTVKRSHRFSVGVLAGQGDGDREVHDERHVHGGWERLGDLLLPGR